MRLGWGYFAECTVEKDEEPLCRRTSGRNLSTSLLEY